MNSTQQSILVIDDEPLIRKLLRISLAAHGYRVLEAGCGREGLALALEAQPDLLVLDLGLPDMDGKELLAELRRGSQVPVLVLSARANDAEKMLALDGGANDYVTKPFNIRELLARVRVLLCRPAPPGQPLGMVSCGSLTVDLNRRLISLDDREIVLTRKEYDVLVMLARHPGRIVSQLHLLREIWGPSHVENTHYLRIVIGHLRQKLGDDPADPRFIVTEAGVGYRLLEHFS